MSLRILEEKVNPNYKYNETIGDINFNFAQLSNGTGGGTVFTGGTVTGATAFTAPLSATTLFSGSTNLYSIFNTLSYFTGSTSQPTGIAVGFTVPIPVQTNAGYKVFLTPTNATSVASPYYVTNKTTNSFDIRYTSPPGGVTIEFDWVLFP